MLESKVTRNQERMVELLGFLLKEIILEPTDKQPDTTDMPEFESEESAEQEKKCKNSEKRKNKIRQLLYSLYRSKKLTKTIYNNGINTI